MTHNLLKTTIEAPNVELTARGQRLAELYREGKYGVRPKVRDGVAFGLDTGHRGVMWGDPAGHVRVRIWRPSNRTIQTPDAAETPTEARDGDCPVPSPPEEVWSSFPAEDEPAL